MTELPPQPKQSLPYSPYLPYDPAVSTYDAGQWHYGFAYPLEFSDWRDEVFAWKKGVAIHAGLNPTVAYLLRGPDALRFLSDNCVNGFAKFPVGGAKHAIMCNDAGQVMIHGMLLHTGKEEFVTQWLSPWINYLAECDASKYNIELEERTYKDFIFQLAGPNTLKVLEATSKQDLRDVRFLNHKRATIAGKSVRVVRVGMSGALGYEVQGAIEDARDVYTAIIEAGQPFEIRRLGLRAYMLSHTEAGFPQFGYHFLAGDNDAKFMDWCRRNNLLPADQDTFGQLKGSAGADYSKHYRNPIELGWGHVVKFDHEFRGRAALEKYATAPERATVTLEWNKEDILDVHASQLEIGEPYAPMELPNQVCGVSPGNRGDTWGFWADNVLDGSGKIIGYSSGRSYSWLYREMISLATIDIAHAKLGNQLRVVWGDPGKRQKVIRATVARYPYLQEHRNESVDVASRC